MIQHIFYNIKHKTYETIVYALKRKLQYNTDNPQVKTPESALAAGKSNKRNLKDIVAFVAQKDTNQMIVGTMIEIRISSQNGIKILNKEKRRNHKLQMLLKQKKLQQVIQQMQQPPQMEQKNLLL
jgi:hypothetical protein